MRALIVKSETASAEAFAQKLPPKFTHTAYAFPEEPWVSLMQAHEYDLVVLHLHEKDLGNPVIMENTRNVLSAKKQKSIIIVVSDTRDPSFTEDVARAHAHFFRPDVSVQDLHKKLTLVFPWGTFLTKEAA